MCYNRNTIVKLDLAFLLDPPYMGLICVAFQYVEVANTAKSANSAEIDLKKRF